MSLSNVLLLHTQLEKHADQGGEVIAEMVGEVREAELKLLRKPLATPDDAKELAGLGLYLCENKRSDSGMLGIIFGKIKDFL